MAENLRIILTSGGTGGHIFPALAVAACIKKKEHSCGLLFVGAQYGQEKNLAEEAGLDFYALPVRGFIGRGLKAITAFFALIKGIFMAYRLLGKYKPHAVIGFGGYACFATVFAACLRGIPTLIHEQNAIPGLANKILSHFVRRICLSLPDTTGIFDTKKSVLTGNPVRAELCALQKKPRETSSESVAKNSGENSGEKPSKTPHILIMGGSLGAVAINSLIIRLLTDFRDYPVNITHQCGKKDYARVREAYDAHGFDKNNLDSILSPFIHDMSTAYANADLAICRAGATSLAELAITGTPSILIPFPHAAHDHQTFNARIFQDATASIMIPESSLNDMNGTNNTDVRTIIFDLIQNQEKLHSMAENAKKLAQPEATENVTREVLTLARERKTL